MSQFGVNRENRKIAEELAYNISGKGKTKLPLSTLLLLIAVATLFVLLPQGEALTMTTNSPAQDFISACQVEHNVTEEELEALPKDPNPIDVDMKIKCYSNCLLQGMGFIDENGKLDAESMQRMGILNDDSYESVIECKAANDMEEDDCEYSFGLMLCVRMIHEEKKETGTEIDEPIEEERRK